MTAATKPGAAFVSGCCEGEKCHCGMDASHKVEETIFHDDPIPHRHPLTTYVCHSHFVQMMGPAGRYPGEIASPAPEGLATKPDGGDVKVGPNAENRLPQQEPAGVTPGPSGPAGGKYPSEPAMRAAVELEIMSALGSVTTQAIGQMIQKAIDASAPASVGEPDAWVVQLKYGENHWSGEMMTDVLPSDKSTYRVLRSLYTAPPVTASVEEVARTCDEARATLNVYKEAMESQEKNMSNAKLIVMANYGDLCAAHLRSILALLSRKEGK